jgi:xylan 1,4-beta-xylosidase
VAVPPAALAKSAPVRAPIEARANDVDVALGRRRRRPADRDLGDGSFLNPVLPGDYPDPTILRDGDDYYMTHSSFEAAPGLLIWHSRDLVNWTPIGTVLAKPLGTVFACDLVKHAGRYYIYIPFMAAPWSKGLASFANIYVIHADSMHGPWSEPIDLKISGLIDPGHVVGEDRRRYLFLSGVHARPHDGSPPTGCSSRLRRLAISRQLGNRGVLAEGPKLTKRRLVLPRERSGRHGWPPTGHMVIVARSRSVNGPWQTARTTHRAHHHRCRRWWSRADATLFEGPDGAWWMVYHGYENGYRTLGRQTPLDRVEWTADGWPRVSAATCRAARQAGQRHVGARGSHARTIFTARLRHALEPRGRTRRNEPGAHRGRLLLAGKGTSPAELLAGDHAYEVRSRWSWTATCREDCCFSSTTGCTSGWDMTARA